MDKQQDSNGHELPSVPPPRVWIEDTKTTTHGHGGPGWEFGSCLWSPSAYEGGSDHYALMREPQIDDLVIHINDGDLVAPPDRRPSILRANGSLIRPANSAAMKTKQHSRPS